MRGIIIGMMVAAMMSTASMASAQSKELAVVPQLVGDMVQLNLPAGVTELNVIVYDDAAQVSAKQLGAVTSFVLLPGQGFNFQWSDGSGEYWQLITLQSPTESGIAVDCGNVGGCKYHRPVMR